jgi:zinc transport system substrate-binding protein
MKKLMGVMGVLAGLLGLAFLSAAQADEPLQVTVSILPQKYFVEKIGGDRVAVTVMVEPGAEPHVYDPKPQQMAALAKSKIYFALGVPFEDAWLQKFTSANPRMKIIHTEAGIQKLPMKAHDPQDEQTGASRQHHAQPAQDGHQEVLDPHVWLSPPLAMIQARNILDGLLQSDPANRSSYEANYKKLMEGLVALDLDLLRLFGEAGDHKEFMVFHPAWGYLAAAYGLAQTPIEVEGKEPKAADLKRLIEHARERQIKALFIQPQYSATSAKVIAEALGAQIVSADPMAQDWENNLRDVAEQFKAAMKQEE